MLARRLACTAFAVCLVLSCVHASAQPSQSDAARPLVAGSAETSLLDPAEFAPERTFAPPPPSNSALEAIELQRLKALRALVSPERIAQAERDGATENPTAFDQAAGRSLAQLPATFALLTRIQRETGRVIGAGKLYFKRLRPYRVDPLLPHCGAGKSSDRAYPSGHAGMGWSVGWVLAKLMPERAPALLARAQDYALSREICGVHFQSDVEASQAVAILIADRLLADSRLSDQVAAARRELARP